MIVYVEFHDWHDIVIFTLQGLIAPCDKQWSAFFCIIVRNGGLLKHQQENRASHGLSVRVELCVVFLEQNKN